MNCFGFFIIFLFSFSLLVIHPHHDHAVTTVLTHHSTMAWYSLFVLKVPLNTIHQPTVLYICSRTSKGFTGQQTVKLNGCTEVYVETLQMFLHALKVPVHRSALHQGVRQFLHRMVVCLDADILPFIPVAMQSLLENADVRELYDFIPFVNQVVQKFKVYKACVTCEVMWSALFVCLPSCGKDYCKSY